MRFVKLITLFVCLSIFSGCQLAFVSPIGVSPSTNRNQGADNSVLPSSYYLIANQFGIAPALVVHDSVSLSHVPSGRVQCFHLEDNLGYSHFLSCGSSAPYFYNNGSLCIRFTLTTALTHNLNCSYDNGSVALQINYDASSITLASEGDVQTLNPNQPAISSDGRYVISMQSGGFLASGSSTNMQIIRYDTLTGQKLLVSSNDGISPMSSPGTSGMAITSDGKYVYFFSSDSNLVPGVNASAGQAFRKNMDTGLVEVVSNFGALLPSSGVAHVSVSRDGRYLVFISAASNLPGANGAGFYQVYLKDMQTGTITLVSKTAAGVLANNNCFSPSVSDDGTKVAFQTNASSLMAGLVHANILVKNMQTGAITLASSPDGVTESNNGSSSPLLSPAGDEVLFLSNSNNIILALGGNGKFQVYVKNLNTGAMTLVSSPMGSVQLANNNAYMNTYMRFESDTGISFYSSASNLIPGVNTGYFQAFKKNLVTGEVTLLSSPDGVTPGDNGANGGGGSGPILSANGNIAFFMSASTNLVSGSRGFHLYKKDLLSGITTLVDTANGSAEANNSSYIVGSTQISSDGQKVYFTSNASNLISGSFVEAGGFSQIYEKDLSTGLSQLISGPSNSVLGNQTSYLSASSANKISSDGVKLTFITSATNLGILTGGIPQVVQKNLQTGTFAENTKYFEPSKKDFMINYRVENLEALVEELKKEGVVIVDKIETYDYGKFVHILDSEGNKIQLWEPID
jgi:hypothetical protein